MLFNVEADTGSCITGYVVPDGFTQEPMLSIRLGGDEVLTIPANQPREALVGSGRHGSGRCGFAIDEDALPGLPGMTDLSLYDVDTQLLIYRRPQPDSIPKRILRLETHLFPLWRLDEALQRRFQYFAGAIDQLGRETVTQLFLLNAVASTYLSGRILFRNYAYFADQQFQTVILLHSPYDEMAERLLVLRNVKKVGIEKLGMRDALGMKGAVDFAAELPLEDERALGRSLRRMPPEAAAVLANPLVRQLTASTPDEMPSGSAVSASLDLLASFAVVGLRREPEPFLHALAQLLDVDESVLPATPVLPAVGALAGMLKRSRAVDSLLDRDIELYEHVAAAFQKSTAI